MRESLGPRGSRRGPQSIAFVLAAALIFSGCMLLRARKDQQQMASAGRIDGRVQTEHASEYPLVVVLLPASALDASTLGEIEIVDHFIRERAGSFAFTVAPGSYLLGAFEDVNADGNYDPDRIPVLFVHGISGYPQEFSEIIDSLDRDAFQAWFYFYPSGFRLQSVAKWGAETMRELQIRYGFDEFAVVAHSMGGLVSRSPVIVECWIDMAPSSDFLQNLFWREDDPGTPRTLPSQTAFHMLWGYGGPDNNTDGVVSIASQQRAEAQAEASSNRSYAENHTGILRSDAVKARINAILAASFA